MKALFLAAMFPIGILVFAGFGMPVLESVVASAAVAVAAILIFA